MKLFAVVVLALACFPVLLGRSSSCFAALHPTLNYPTGTTALSAALNAGSAGVEVSPSVDPAHPNNRGFLVSTALQPHGVQSIAKAAFHLSLAHLQTPYSHVHHWLRVNTVRLIGGVVAVCQYLLFLIVGLAFLRKQIVHGLPQQSELVVVPIPVGPTGSVIECRVPDTRAPVPAAKPLRRPLARRPLLNSTIHRLGGPKTNTAPQPLAPVHPPRPGSWIEHMSVEGKLILYSHHTGPDGSPEWTAQYFPRREYSYYLAQYPANPNIDPVLRLLLSFRPFTVKVPAEIMEEVRNYVFSELWVQPEVDVTSTPPAPSKPEHPEGPTSIDMIESLSALTLTPQSDSGSEAVVTLRLSAAANTDTNSVEARSLPLPQPKPAARRRYSCPNLGHAPSRHQHSSRRASIAIEPMARHSLSRPESPDDPTSINVMDSSNSLNLTQNDSDSEVLVPSTADADANSVEVGSFPLPHLKPTARRRYSYPHIRTNFAHALPQQGHSSRRASVAGEQVARLYFFRSESPDSSYTQREPDSEAVVSPDADADANSVEAGYFSTSHPEPARRRRHSCPDLRTQFSHAPSQQVHSSRRVSIAVDQRARLRPVRNEPQLSHEKEAAMEGSARRDNINEEVKFKFRRGGRRNTARKHKRQMQEQDPGNLGAGPSSAH